MDNYKYTYTHGFKFKVLKDFRKRDYINLCEDISLELSLKHGELILVKPEPITEGGLRVYQGDGYKSIRHRLNSPFYNKNILKWPHIGNNVVEVWKNSDKIIFPDNVESKTFLKSFDSPLWTIDELKIVGDCMKNSGIYTYDFPTEKDLITTFN